MPRQRRTEQAVEWPSQSRSRWVIGLAVAITTIALASTAYTSQTMYDLMGTLIHNQERLRSTDNDAVESIDEWFQRQEIFLVKIARQSQPARDLATTKADLHRVFTRFTRNRHYVDAFPTRVASAHYRLGQLYALDGNNGAAVESLYDSILIAEREGFHEQVALSRNTLGCVLTALGKYPLALQQFTRSASLLKQSPTSPSSASVIFRNAGLLQQLSGADGSKAVLQSIRLLRTDSVVGEFSVARELLIDSQMTLCEILWSQGKFAQAIDVCKKARGQLETFLDEVQNSSLDSDLAALNRYLNAIRFIDRNLAALETNATNDDDSILKSSVDAWQWPRLVNLATEIVPEGLSLTATMSGEFETQSGLVLAWGMFDWTHDVVTEIVAQVHDRVQLLILVDNDESLDEAKSTFDSLSVSLDRIRFAVCNYESPWFRDMGPIAAKSASGQWIWFDSSLTRESKNTREVTDAIPRMIRRNWNVRVVPSPLHVEGGTVLSNGKGLSICSTHVIEANRAYGFDDETIDLEMRRITGAKTLAVVQPLIGEETKHVDLFITFTDENTVVVGEYRDPKNPNQRLLNEHANMLSRLKGADNLRVVRMPMPEPIESEFRSYTNVVYANGVLLVPSYSDPMDAEAVAIYQRLLPNWRIELIDCTKTSTRGGALHCLVSNLGNTPYTPMPIRIRGKAAGSRRQKSDLAK